MNHGFPGRRMRLTLLLTASLLAVGVTAGSASASTQTFTNPSVVAIVDEDVAVPYPSTVTASGVAGPVQKVTVTLNRFQHTFANDVAVLLVGPGGQNTILMGRVGGIDPTGPIDLTFDQASSNELNEVDVATSGTYKPSEGATKPDPFDPPAPIGPDYPVDLNVFNGAAGDGDWKLFIEDQVSGDDGAVRGWSLHLTAPFNTTTVGTPTLNKKKGTALVPVTVKDAGNVSVSGAGVATVASKSVAVGGPGTVNVPVRATGKKKKKLNSKGKVNVSATITFTPTGGTASSTPVTLQLKKKK
jgi:subtilisin-like proprotein convertase family protein